MKEGPRERVSRSPGATDTLGFIEPGQWPWDGGKRREPVLDCDHKPPREVRKVGWRCCMKCSDPFWSHDVVRLRMCSACKP